MMYVLIKATINPVSVYQYTTHIYIYSSVYIWFTIFTLQNKPLILFRRVFRSRLLMFFKNVYHTHTLGDICTYIDAKLIGKTQKPVTMISEF
jgi:hypothetical protein